jgi:nucleotide-binding universal stress UspA family protein
VLTRIVVAVDPSPASESAAKLAIAIAGQYARAQLAFCHVIDIPRMLAHAERCCDDYALELEVARDGAQRVLDACTRLASEAGVEASGSIRFGKPATEVVAFAGAIGADLVVVGHRHKRAMWRLFPESVGHEMVRVSRIPVLVAGLSAAHYKEMEEKTTL